LVPVPSSLIFRCSIFDNFRDYYDTFVLFGNSILYTLKVPSDMDYKVYSKSIPWSGLNVRVLAFLICKM
jgi:hypothetical protein